MTPIRVLVVEDSLTVRKYLVEVLQSRPDFEVIGEAVDGKQAIELCERLRPDLVTMDMVLPIMTGVAATEYIMAYCPTPILIVSASTNRGQLYKTYDALQAGAVDVIEKPQGDEANEGWERTFLTSVKMVSRIKVITHPRARLRAQQQAAPLVVRKANATEAQRGHPWRLVTIGVSTGGPAALAEILGSLPADFPLPILIVMHINPIFGSAFADWLKDQTRLPVTTAVQGEVLPAVGRPGVILAPADRHMTLKQGRIWLDDGPEIHSCRPAVDALFESVATEIGGAAIALLLTGMGRDGARGLLAVRKAGGMTMAQDERTSIVFGMPREAILIDAAQRILPLGEMAANLLSLTAAAEGGRP